MRIDLAGRRALVTGSTAGIGLAIAKGLAGAGATVLVNGRGEARVAAALDAIRAEVPGANLIAAPADLATADGAGSLVAMAGEVDILVNNLGKGEFKPFEDITDQDWMALFELNVMSGIRMSRALLPGMVARGWGRVVFISSESGVNIPKDMIHYGVTKISQLAVSRGLAESVAGTGVTVNSVLPGPTRSEGVSAMIAEAARAGGKTTLEAERDFLAAFRPTSLLGRFSSTEEVANMVVYVCSPQAAATSGAALRVDGGVVRFIA